MRTIHKVTYHWKNGVEQHFFHLNKKTLYMMKQYIFKSTDKLYTSLVA